TMQGSKKHTEGHSDSSSIGSLLDDADREVSSLTDRAFKSLCVAELDDSFNEPDLAISPDFALQFSAKFHPGTLNHAIKKSTVCNNLTARNNEHTRWASTFQQLPKCAPEEKRADKNNTFATGRRNLNLPVPGPRNNKHISKVSSLIKTFDRTTDQGSLTAMKQPVKNSFRKCQLNHGNYVACWDDTDILSNHKELSEFADPSQGSHCISGKHELQKRPNRTGASPCGSDGYYPVLLEMSKVAKSNFSHSSKKAFKTKRVKVNEPAKKGNFLHSENSAFESWNVHHKKLTEKEEFVGVNVKEEGLTCVEEASFVEGSQPLEQKLPPVKAAVAKKQEKDFQIKPASPEATFSIPHPSVCMPQGLLPPDTEFPQQGSQCPPWRRQRAAKGAAERIQTSKEKFTDFEETCSLPEKVTGAEPTPDVTPLAKRANSPGSTSPTFNITELLTPILPLKQEVDAVDSELIMLTPPPTESTASKDNEGSTSGDYKSWDSYKSKASSLLFNLKDVRKRVKSIYTPSPMLRALEEKHKARENVQESTKMNPSFSILQEKGSKSIAEKDESSGTGSALPGSTQERDSKADFTGHFTDSLSSPQTAVDLLFYQTGDNLQQDNPKHEQSTKDAETFTVFRQESNDPALKRLQYPTLKPLGRASGEVTAGQPEQNGSVQGEENERQTATQSENVSFKTPPNQLSPAEDVPYSDVQTTLLVPGHEAQGKRSTSSSEQSFVSTVEQPLQEELLPPAPLMQKACLPESQKTESEMGTDSKKSHGKGGNEVGEDELQYYACVSSGTDTAEQKEESATDNEEKSLMKEKLKREKKEEANHMDSASDSVRDVSVSRSEEPQTPPSSSSTKPSLFMIKDNTFRSPQVIRTVKLPLFRSFSLDDTVSSSYKEMESRFMPPAKHNRQHQKMLHAQEVGWFALKCRRQQNVKDGATDKGKEASEPGSTVATLDPSGTECFSLGKLMEYDKETYALLNKVGKKNEEDVCRGKDKPQTRKARLSLIQPNLGVENDQAQSNSSYLAERQTNYFKNNNLFHRRGGSCAKKIITREITSPVSGTLSEDHAYSPVSHEALEYIPHREGASVLSDSLACSAVPSPRSGSTMYSLAASSSSDKPRISGCREIEDVASPASLHMGLRSQADTSVEQIHDAAQRSLLSERQEPVEAEDRAAGKPPAVPPKTEKALRRAKKLASRRKKMQEQQKNHQTGHADAVGEKHSHSGQMLASPTSLGYASLHPGPHSTSTHTETSTGRPSGPSTVSPSPSSSHRKILQDPDSGQYYVVDLPAEVNLKTFYDPETGKYIQVSVPSLEGNVHQSPSSEIMSSPYASYPKVLPLPASSVAVLKSPSQLSEPTWLMTTEAGEPVELPEDGQQDCSHTEVTDTQPYTEPAPYSYRQDAGETQVHLGKDTSPTTNTNLASLTEFGEFAAEGVS
ncbi:CEFIP protein, partial [Upupa epops]|nr:CEFIP protein [Upupa epops]